MNRIRITTLLSLALLLVTISQPATAKMGIIEATLYPYSAEVVKEGKIKVVKGQTRVELCTIPKDTKNSYRVTLLSTSVSLLGYEAVPIKNDEEIDGLERDILVLRTERKAIALRIKLIEKLIELMGEGKDKNGSPVLIPLSKVMDRDEKLEQWLTRSRVREQEIEKEIKAKREKLNSLKNRKGFRVFAHVKGMGKGIMRVSFVTRKAWWKPVYKAVLHDNGKISFSMMARCSQNTGENWRGIELRFAATRPGNRLYPVEPSPLWVRPVEPLRNEVRMARKSAPRALMATPAPREEAASFKELQVGGIYTIKGSASLPSKSERRFALGTWKLNVLESTRKSYPSVDPGVYLQVKTPLPPVALLNGRISLYQEEVESGSTMLNRLLKGDYLLFSFGRDRKITVKRELVYRYVDQKFGNKEEITNRYRVTITNARHKPVKVDVTEPFPISQDERIKVSFCTGYPSPLPTKVNREKGLYTWILGVKPGKSTRIEYCYKVKYPKDLQLNHRF